MARVDIPAFDDLGDKRPEIVLGLSLFQTAVVRIDYSRREVVLSPKAEGGLVSASAIPARLRVVNGELVVEGTFEGNRGFFVLDTGSTRGFDLYRSWAEPRGLLAGRRAGWLRGRFGAGAEETMQQLIRHHSAEVGPLRIFERLARIDDPASTGTLAGAIGNEVLSQCAAIVVDYSNRTLWFEPPCDRPVPEQRVGWVLTRRDDAAFPGRPWVIGSLLDDGPGMRAGLQAGDRLLRARA